MTKPAAIPYFGDAYLADTRHLTLEEHGAYHLLILIAWRSPNCALPDDDRRLAQMLGVTAKKWAALKPVVMAFWTRTENGFEQKRLTKEFRYVTKSREQKAEAANHRWNAKPLKDKSEGDAKASPPHMQNACGNDAPPPPPPQETTPDGVVVPLKRGPTKTPISATWLPADFNPDTKCFGIVHRWDRQRWLHEVEAFRAHHGSRASVMADWQAAWQTWVLNSDKFDKQGGRNDRGNTSRNAGAAAAAFGDPAGWTDDRTF